MKKEKLFKIQLKRHYGHAIAQFRDLGRLVLSHPQFKVGMIGFPSAGSPSAGSAVPTAILNKYMQMRAVVKKMLKNFILGFR